MNLVIAGLVTLLCFIANTFGRTDDCLGPHCKKEDCWEYCFEESSDKLSTSLAMNNKYLEAVYQIYQMFQGVRNLYLPCYTPHGTAYMLDSAVGSVPGGPMPEELFEYQRNLASIIALTQPVSNKCNPFFLNKYYQNFAWYQWSWQCQERCEAVETLSSANVKQHTLNGNPSWITGGCILADYAMNNPGPHQCSETTQHPLLVAIANSKLYELSDPYCSKYNRIIIGTDPAADLVEMYQWASPGMAYLLPADKVHMEVARELLNCMQYECCSNKDGSDHHNVRGNYKNITSSKTERKTREDFINYVGHDEIVHRYAGTMNDFLEKMV